MRTACACSLLLLAVPAVVQAQSFCTNSNGTITIWEYNGLAAGVVTIPDSINFLPVTCVGYQAFHNCTRLTSVTIPDTVTSIEDYAFDGCPSLVNPLWSPLATNTPSSGSSYFSDPQWTSYPSRFYRLTMP